MEFKHAFHVFVDNFFNTYKLLVYRLIVIAITVGLGCAVVIPTLNNLLSTAQFEKLQNTFTEFWANIVALNVNELHEGLEQVMNAFNSFSQLIKEKSGLVAVAGCCLALVYFIAKFLADIG
ncbi:MAG: hypothetical protein K2O67_05035, partial [Clostridia bacterium]|nr:hypothetical protein [Clostridia bacterium]